MQTVIITRHTSFTDHLRAIGLIDDQAQIIPHADADSLRGKRVITSGLPLHLAALATEVVTVPLHLPAELRGVELTQSQIADHAGDPATFRVQQI